MIKLYQVKNWNTNFEGAKSKTYNNKTSCSMPCKHGLGFKRVIRSKDGVAMFGAWCALIQVLSRHNKGRDGYCTDTGLKNGNPYTFDDLEMLTDIPAKYFDKMLNFCSSKSVGWVGVTTLKDTMGDCEDTTVDCEDTLVPLNLDSNLDSDSNSDYLCTEPQSDSAPDEVVMIFECNGRIREWRLMQSKVDEWVKTYDGVDVISECKKARQWINDNKSKRKTANGMTRFLGGWISRAIDRGDYSKSTQTKQDHKHVDEKKNYMDGWE